MLRVSAAITSISNIPGGSWTGLFYYSFGILSWGEGPRFYGHFSHNCDKSSDNRSYQNGGCGLFEMRPYEFMESFDSQNQATAAIHQRRVLAWFLTRRKSPKTSGPTFFLVCCEFQRVSIIGMFAIFVVIPLGLAKGRIVLDKSVILVFLAHCGIVGLHLLGARVVCSRTFASFFLWIYLGLAATSIWLWHFVREHSFLKRFPTFFSGLIVIHVFIYTSFPAIFQRNTAALAL